MAPAFLLATAVAAAPAALADIATPSWSGLPWRSGTSGIPNCLAALRGRAVDAGTLFLGNPSFPGLVWQTSGLRPSKGRPPLLVVSLPLLPADNRGQFAPCAAGQFDGSFRQVGANLQKAGAPGTVVRLGWEANLGSRVHFWGVDGPDQVPAYKACWRRAALALKAGGPALNLEWTNGRRTGNTALRVLDTYPGDDVVDLWGVDYYDSGLKASTQALWDAAYKATFNGGPFGLGTWLAAARQHGKRLAVSEWGVWRQGTTTAAQADDPVYVDNMYRFFRDNAGSVAYETYFDADVGDGDHALCHADGTPTLFPNAAAAYKADWGLGQ